MLDQLISLAVFTVVSTCAAALVMIVFSFVTGVRYRRKVIARREEQALTSRLEREGVRSCGDKQGVGKTTTRIEGPFVKWSFALSTFAAGYVMEQEDQIIMISFGRPETLARLNNLDSGDDEDIEACGAKSKTDVEHTAPGKRRQLKVYEKQPGNFSYVYYMARTCRIWRSPDDRAWKAQQDIVDDIVAQYTRTHRADYDGKPFCFVLVHGSPGSGKSFIGWHVTRALSGRMVLDCRPDAPGDGLSVAVEYAQPTAEEPAIVLIDEIDKLFVGACKKDEQKSAVLNSKVSTSVTDKSGLNSFMDRVPTYDNILVIGTTNLTPEDIAREADPSVIRPGRIDKIYRLEPEAAARAHCGEDLM